jgi:hypothetical protein
MTGLASNALTSRDQQDPNLLGWPLGLACLPAGGQRRAPSIPDLITAATAELAGLTVLHLDKDFELIAQIPGQPAERLNIQ